MAKYFYIYIFIRFNEYYNSKSILLDYRANVTSRCSKILEKIYNWDDLYSSILLRVGGF